MEKAAAQAAAVALGQPKTTTGRYRGVIERAVHFRLLAIEEGSVVPVLELPEPPIAQDALNFEVVPLGESAVTLLLDAAQTRHEPPDPTVAKAVLEVADGMLVGARYEAVVFDSAVNGQSERRVRVDQTTRTRLRAYVDAAPVAPSRNDAVLGVLVEADFEKRTARLRTPTEAAIDVDFFEDLDDDIYAALRKPATLLGEVVYDAQTRVAKAVHLRTLERAEQLILGVDPSVFWSEPSFRDLARRQGTGAPAEPEALYDAEATEDEKQAFMAALSELS